MSSRSTHRAKAPALTPLLQHCSRTVARLGAVPSTLLFSLCISLLSLALTWLYLRMLGYESMGEAFYISLLVPLPMTLLPGGIIFALVAALEQARHEAQVQSLTDSLTGLGNRRYFVQAAQPLLLPVQRQPLALLLLDVDHFKRVNDMHGHGAGDQVLVEVARRCTQTLRPGDVLARWGGEEFIALLPVTALAEAQKMAERMRAAVAYSAQLYAQSDAVRVTVSIGVALLQAGESGVFDTLVQAADRALFEAKRAGRNQVALASNSHSGFGTLPMQLGPLTTG
ncbi:GGDEF domain-containing protein [Rhodoferax sp.]|uniref:GGDEF domain-containing protein n=1 Tax=Rhodoferax sp. TaxID=50421 RepID=UPI00374DA551